MEVDDPNPNVASAAPPTAFPAPTITDIPTPSHDATIEVPTLSQIASLESKLDPSNSIEPSTPSEEVTFENNEFYRLAMIDFEDWSSSVPRIVSSPVTTAHLSKLPPISTLSVYSAIHDVSTIQSSLNNSTQTYGAASNSVEFVSGAETSPFLCSNLKRLWHPLPAPPSSLIDSTLPNPLQEWHSMSLHTSVPQMDILVDPEKLAQDGVLIKWRSVGPFAKVRRLGKRAAASIEATSSAIEPPKEVVDPPTSIKPLPRNAKKRFRENPASNVADLEFEGEQISKRRKEANELFIRFPVALALSITQHTFGNSSPPSKRKNLSHPNGNNLPMEASAAELLASFQTS